MAVKFEHDDNTPPEDINVMVDDDVVTLPPESSMDTTGWVVKADPAAPATGSVVKTNCVAAPAPEGEMYPLTAVRAPGPEPYCAVNL